MTRSETYEARNKEFREVFTKPLDLAAVAVPTAKVILDESQKLGLPHYVEDVPESQGARLHWLGDPSAQKVILYFHGGGFALPPLTGHVIFFKQIIDHLAEKGRNVAIAAVEYSLSPKFRYPTQIVQGVESLRFVMQKGYAPSDITIGGDSAGGNLTLSVISVILHQFSNIKPLQPSEPFAGLLLICPWISYSTESKSWEENANKDSIPAVCEVILADAYVDAKDRNNYSEAGQADVSWWKDIPARKILNVFGGYECFRDHVKELGRKIQQAGNNIENVECPSQVHIDCVLDLHCDMETGVMTTEILNWLTGV